MKHKINPTVDCVFKAILGTEKNKNLLIHFLNAILEPKQGERIQDVTLLNPYNEREFIGDKLTIVDVKAIDESGKMYQIEIQLAMHAALDARILYTWSHLYHSQIQDGDNYQKLQPVISIWILNGILFEKVEECHLPFSVYNIKHQLIMTDHLAIHLLQLPKWQSIAPIASEKERWLYLFKEGQNVDLDNPPSTLNTEEMRQVMKVLQRFSENETDYLLYQSRLDAVLKENTYITALEQALKVKEQALKEKEMAVKDKEQQVAKVKEQAAKEKEQALKEKEMAAKDKEQAVKQQQQVENKLNDLMLLLEKKGIVLDDELKA
jgi:predicted transposase/invertase (TIGR01784 family)